MGGRNRGLLVRIALCAGATLAALGLALFLFIASGIYNVAASRGHFIVTEWLLHFALRRSVATHSSGITAPGLADPDMVRLGAGHFATGCAPCHGAPGQPRSPIVQSMLPPPPDLAEAAPTWSREQLFWIVQNGLKYTGMPAWVAPPRDDEVWSVIAFLLQLPELDENAYRALVNPADKAPGGIEPGADTRSLAQQFCGRCHGDHGELPIKGVVPRLAGQSPRYLASALHDYAAGLRPSGIMQPIAAALGDQAIARLAEHYAGLPVEPGTHPASAISPEQRERGRVIATLGIPEAKVPPCNVCHAAGISSVFPRLAGQHARYLAQQLHVFKKGLRDRSARGAIMAPIARRLTERQIDEVAAYFESLAPSHAGTVSQRHPERREAQP